MRLQCPRCDESVPYDAALAGKQVTCPWCKTLLRMPTPEELPEQAREEYRREVAKELAKRGKQEQAAARARKQREETLQRQVKEVESASRDEEAWQEGAQKKREAEWRQEQEAAEKEGKMLGDVATVPEETVIAASGRYPALGAVAAAYVLFAVLNVIGAGAAAIAILRALGNKAPGETILPFVILLVLCFFSAVFCWGASQLTTLAVDVANDLRITRLLLRRMAYPPATGDETVKPS